MKRQTARRTAMDVALRAVVVGLLALGAAQVSGRAAQVPAVAPAAAPAASRAAASPANHAQAGNAQAQPQPGAAKEQGFDQAQVSLWLKPMARALHVSTGLLWAVVYWINFALLAYFLYFLLCRLKVGTLAGTMRARAQTIRRRLSEADEARSEASERLRSIERRLDNLQREVAELREQAAQEAEAEYQRLAGEAGAEAERIARYAEQHIEAAAKTARQELRHFAGDLAVAMAERQLRRQLTAEMDRQVVRASLEGISNDGGHRA